MIYILRLLLLGPIAYELAVHSKALQTYQGHDDRSLLSHMYYMPKKINNWH